MTFSTSKSSHTHQCFIQGWERRDSWALIAPYSRPSSSLAVLQIRFLNIIQMNCLFDKKLILFLFRLLTLHHLLFCVYLHHPPKWKILYETLLTMYRGCDRWCIGGVTGGGRGNCSCGTGVSVRLAMSDWKRWVISQWQVSVLENPTTRHTKMNTWTDKEQPYVVQAVINTN